jgi:hypothetical protein
MANIEDLPPNTHVMVPLGDVLHKGVITEPRADHPVGEGMICVELTPPVKTLKPYDSIDFITCAASSVMLGWWLLGD